VGWRKLGRVYVAGDEHDWALTHAYCPTSMLLDEERIRVFVAFLDAEKVGRVGYVDVSAQNPLEVLEVSRQPVLDVGGPGCFDDSGVTPLSLCEGDEGLRLYYAGWQLGVRVRYFLFLGLAVSFDGGASFQRASRAPVLDRSDAEPLIRTGAHVQRDGDCWRMWYAGGDSWVSDGGKEVPSYPLRYLESRDGIEWGPSGEACLEPVAGAEIGFARPCIVEDAGRLRMWFSIRPAGGEGYRLGYAESDDGRHWERLDERAGIGLSDSGWDSEAIGLSCLQPTKYGTYLFYNGNGFGEAGFGAALEEPD
jgi:hypothetical protein